MSQIEIVAFQFSTYSKEVIKKPPSMKNEDKTIGAEGCRFKPSEKKKVVLMCYICFKEEEHFYTCAICGGDLKEEIQEDIRKRSSKTEVSTSSLASSPTSSSPGGPRVKQLRHRRSWADNTGNSSFRVDSTEEEREGDKDDQEKEEQDTSHEEDEEEGQGGQEEKEEEEASSTSSPGQLRTIVIDGSNIACLHGRQKTFSVKGLLTSKLILRPTFSISLSPFHHLRFLVIF